MVSEDPDRRFVVHLVHGTWAKGIFRRHSRRSLKSSLESDKPWFAKNSIFRTRIEEELQCKIDFRILHWDGRNSFYSRFRAALKLAFRIACINHHSPDKINVIVGHSHGGTIGAFAIAKTMSLLLPWPGASRAKVAALVTLATPFVFVERAPKELSYHVYPWILAVLVWATIVLFGWNYSSALQQTHPLLLFAIPILMGALVSESRLLFPLFPSNYQLGRISKKTKIFALRATRDEASLSIGLASTMNAIAAKLMLAADARRPYSSIATFLPYLMTMTPLGIGAYWLMFQFDPVPTIGQMIALCWPLATFPLALAVFGTHLLIALASGLRDIRHIANCQIEVDGSPPDSWCEIKLLSNTMNEGDLALRHALYELEEVQCEVARIIRRTLRKSGMRLH